MNGALAAPAESVSTLVARNISEFRAAVSESFVPLQVSTAGPCLLYTSDAADE